MARIENGEWVSAAVVIDDHGTTLYVGGERVEHIDGERASAIWLKPDEDGCRVVLRAAPEDE